MLLWGSVCPQPDDSKLREQCLCELSLANALTTAVRISRLALLRHEGNAEVTLMMPEHHTKYFTLHTLPSSTMGKPRLIILIRHAQSEGNKNREIHQMIPDHRVKLTDEGWRQVRYNN